MKNNQNKGIWGSVDELTNSTQYQELANQEFQQSDITDEKNLSVEGNRRDFLKYLGFGLGAATLASSCEIPLKRAIPYVIKPDEIVPGVATYYASSFVRGGDYCSILVKTREGRPIKIEGNSLSAVTKGGTSARTQACVLDLYDTSRITGPARVENGKIALSRKKGEGMTWEELDKAVTGKWGATTQIRIVTHTNMSPTFEKVIGDFVAKYPNTQVVTYDPVSSSALLDANEMTFGIRAIPSYRFDKAETIVSFEADFLGTWISPIEFAAQYAENRKIKDPKKPTMSRHIQIESNMSLTGSNADHRILVKPSEQGAAIVALYNEVARLSNGQQVNNGPQLKDDQQKEKIKKVATELLRSRTRSLVVSSSNNIGEQILINAINYMLGNYDATIDFSYASMQRKGDDKAIQALVTEMNAGKVDALLVLDAANPAYDLPNADNFVDAMAKVGMKVSLSSHPNETTLNCNFVAPSHYFLESWGDVMPKLGQYSLVQPTIAPLFDTRQAEESLLRWANSEDLDTEAEQPYFEYLKNHWETVLFNDERQEKFRVFQAFWDSCLHDGVLQFTQPKTEVTLNADVVFAAKKVRKPANAGLEVAFYETVNIGGGQYAGNPWLLEMPDPVTRCSWDNFLSIPISWDGDHNFTAFKNLNERESYGQNDIVEVSIKDIKQEASVVKQFGQMKETLGLAVGYGRTSTGLPGKALGNKVGVNVYPWMHIDEDGYTQYYAEVQNVSDPVSFDKQMPCVQYHHTMGVTEKGSDINIDEKAATALRDPFSKDGFQGGIVDRSIVYKTNLPEFEDLLHHIEEKRSEAEKLNEHTIYPYEEYKEEFYDQGHHWGMHVDLNACIGCGACQVACIAENNVPVVGKTEVARHHEMTWLRIDRYYFGDYENPNVVYQPMMCQHCDNAPCENVCPVAATNHSSEGLNQMTYNRCIGTRYCANNCPYKVRRFNWLDYTTADIFPANEYYVNDEEIPYGADNLTRMVLNPDVTVRSRGVIEKCSFCVQRIQEGKLLAKREQRSLRDSDVKTACQTACPTGAIVFGDQNNKSGALAKKLESPLNYVVLEEINARSSVNYSAKVTNKKEELDA